MLDNTSIANSWRWPNLEDEHEEEDHCDVTMQDHHHHHDNGEVNANRRCFPQIVVAQHSPTISKSTLREKHLAHRPRKVMRWGSGRSPTKERCSPTKQRCYSTSSLAPSPRKEPSSQQQQQQKPKILTITDLRQAHLARKCYHTTTFVPGQKRNNRHLGAANNISKVAPSSDINANVTTEAQEADKTELKSTPVKTPQQETPHAPTKTTKDKPSSQPSNGKPKDYLSWLFPMVARIPSSRGLFHHHQQHQQQPQQETDYHPPPPREVVVRKLESSFSSSPKSPGTVKTESIQSTSHSSTIFSTSPGQMNLAAMLMDTHALCTLAQLTEKANAAVAASNKASNAKRTSPYYQQLGIPPRPSPKGVDENLDITYPVNLSPMMMCKRELVSEFEKVPEESSPTTLSTETASHEDDGVKLSSSAMSSSDESDSLSCCSESSCSSSSSSSSSSSYMSCSEVDVDENAAAADDDDDEDDDDDDDDGVENDYEVDSYSTFSSSCSSSYCSTYSSDPTLIVDSVPDSIPTPVASFATPIKTAAVTTPTKTSAVATPTKTAAVATTPTRNATDATPTKSATTPTRKTAATAPKATPPRAVAMPPTIPRHILDRFVSKKERSLKDQIATLTQRQRNCLALLRHHWDVDHHPMAGYLYLRFAQYCQFDLQKGRKLLSSFDERYTKLTVMQLEPQILSLVIPIPGLKTLTGQEMFLTRPALFNPRLMTTQVLKDSMAYVMLALMEKEEAATKGIGCILYLNYCTMEHFSLDYCWQFMKLLQGGVPVQISNLFIVNPPSWFGMIWNIMKPMLQPAFIQKVKMIPERSLSQFLAGGYMAYLPRDMRGGTVDALKLVQDFVVYRKYVEDKKGKPKDL